MKFVRKLAAAGGCKSGNCPTVYLTDRGTLVIQGYLLEPGAALELTLPSGESAVEVPAALILEAARQVEPDEVILVMATRDLAMSLVQPEDPTGHLSPAEFGGLFQSFTTSAFRLETLAEYRVEESAHRVALFLNGTPLPPDRNDAWCQLVAGARKLGKRMSRVHVVPRRLTPYLRYEIEWGYVFNAEAGEEILLLPHDQPSELFATWPLPDFWLFDDGTDRCTCVRMHYDATGQFLFGQLVTDPSEIDGYRRARDISVAHASSLQQYLAELRNS